MKKLKHIVFILLYLITPIMSYAQSTTPEPPTFVTFGGPGGLLGLPLAHADDDIFNLLGSYVIPDNLGIPYGAPGGGFAVSEDGNSMYISSFRGAIAKYSIPNINEMATIEFGWKLTPDSVPSDNNIHGALVEYNGELYKTKYAEYVTQVTSSKWIQKGSTNGDNFSNLYNVSGVDNPRRLAQGFMHIPEIWQSTLGGSVAVLGSRLSITSQSQNGYGFAVFSPENIGSNNSVTPLLDYTFSNPLEPQYSAIPGFGYNSNGGNDLYSRTSAPLASALIVPGSRSLLFITTHGYGPGTGTGKDTSGCRPGSSVYNHPYRMQVVAYDLVDLVNVKNGTVNPHDVQPYEWWEWNAGGVVWDQCVGRVPLMVGFGAYDPVNSRWYMDAEIGDDKVYVWNVNSL